MKPLVDTNWGREAELAASHLKAASPASGAGGAAASPFLTLRSRGGATCVLAQQVTAPLCVCGLGAVQKPRGLGDRQCCKQLGDTNTTPNHIKGECEGVAHVSTRGKQPKNEPAVIQFGLPGPVVLLRAG